MLNHDSSHMSALNKDPYKSAWVPGSLYVHPVSACLDSTHTHVYVIQRSVEVGTNRRVIPTRRRQDILMGRREGLSRLRMFHLCCQPPKRPAQVMYDATLTFVQPSPLVCPRTLVHSVAPLSCTT